MSRYSTLTCSSQDALQGSETTPQGNPLLCICVTIEFKWTVKKLCVKNACKQEITNLVSHKRPLVQLEELLAVLAVISTCTKLYKCPYLAGSVSYFVCNLYMKQYVKIITAIKKRVCNL